MWNDDDTPLAYFISFRAYGTWLHGDERGSTDRHNNIYGTPHIPPNPNWNRYSQELLKNKPVNLNVARRRAMKAAIEETCSIRGWHLLAFNIRTSHAHTVVDTRGKKGSIALNAFKANATRHMREKGCWKSDRSPWADKGSCRRLWNEQSVADAIEYVLHGQGDDLPE